MDPKVTIHNKNITRERNSRGFSLGELKEAKIAVDRTKSLGIILDSRRNTVYEKNIALLKDILNENIELKKQRKTEAKKQIEEAKSEKTKKKTSAKKSPAKKQKTEEEL